MSNSIDNTKIDIINNYDVEQRFAYLLKETITNDELWILTDEHGCVMLNTADEDCVPVWPNKEFAQSWATGEWAACQPVSVDLDTWFSRWIPGLIDDELAIVAFPNNNDEGQVLFPDEFEYELIKKRKKLKL